MCLSASVLYFLPFAIMVCLVTGCQATSLDHYRSGIDLKVYVYMCVPLYLQCSARMCMWQIRIKRLVYGHMMVGVSVKKKCDSATKCVLK